MSYIYLIRHAQAGSRDNYDVLSEHGHLQARLLGEHFVRQRIEFAAVYSGSMRRQRHTAEIALDVCAQAGLAVPDIITEGRWDEFSLASVYRAIASRMMAADEAFARDFREMQEALRRDPHTTRGATGRCDAAVIRAWMENRYPDYAGESWEAFHARILSCIAAPPSYADERPIAVFTSATPVAIIAGAALGLTQEKLMSILGVIYNSSLTVVRAREGELRLFTFNSTPHLDDALRTFR